MRRQITSRLRKATKEQSNFRLDFGPVSESGKEAPLLVTDGATTTYRVTAGLIQKPGAVRRALHPSRFPGQAALRDPLQDPV